MHHPDEEPELMIARVLTAELDEVLNVRYSRIDDLKLKSLKGKELLALFVSVGTALGLVAIQTHDDNSDERNAGQRNAAEHIDNVVYEVGVSV